MQRLESVITSHLRPCYGNASLCPNCLIQRMRLNPLCIQAIRTFAVASHYRPNVVVLGTGWGSHRFVSDLDHNKYRVTVISPRDHMLFTPLLTSTAVGTLEHRSIIESVRADAAEKSFSYLQAKATYVDFDNNEATCVSAVYSEKNQFALKYNYLVVGVGAVPNTFGIPGVKENTFFLKEAKDARAIRHRIHDCFEAASFQNQPRNRLSALLTFVVVGGGPTGVEFAAELSDFIREDCTRLYPGIAKYARVILVEAGGNVLSAFDNKLRDYALKKLTSDICQVRLGHRVQEVFAHEIILDNGEKLQSHCIVWSTGIGPSPLVASLDKRFLTENLQSIRVGRSLQIANTINAFAIGDCCQIDDYVLPPVAQVAEQQLQGQFLAAQFNSQDLKQYVLGSVNATLQEP
eukprot:gene5779-7276_t